MELNKIYNEDCYEGIKKIPDKSIDLIVTDPPYEIYSLHRGAGLLKNRGTGLLKNRGTTYVDEMIALDVGGGINLSILDEFVRVMKKINIYIWCNKEQILDYLTYFNKLKCNFEIIVWGKPNPAPFVNGHYLKDKEYCLFFWESGVKLFGTYKTLNTIYTQKINVEDKKYFEHPTIKPLNIIKNLIINSSQAGGVILDPFLGSGTTAVACKELGRNYIGFEISPKYYKIAVDRVNGITSTGQTTIFTEF